MTLDTNYLMISRRFRQFETDIANLAWRSFTSNIVLDDIYLDNLTDTTGINNSLSSYLFDSTNLLVYKPTSSDMTIVTNPWTSNSLSPTSAFCNLEILPIDSYTINTDIQVYFSEDSGSHYQQFMDLYEMYTFQSTGISYLRGEITSLTTYSSNQIILKILTLNSKNIKVSALSIGVRF